MSAPRSVTHVCYFAEIPGRVTFSGAENHLFTLMGGQLCSGVDVALVMMNAYPGPALAAKAAELRKAGIQVFELDYGGRGRIRRRLSLLLHLPRMFRIFRARRHGVVHTHLELPSQIGRIVAWSAGCRRIVDSIHCDEPHFARWDWKVRLRFLDALSVGTIAITDHVKEYLVQRCGMRRSRVSVVRYGVHKSGDTLGKEGARSRLQIPHEAKVVGYVGRLVPQKDLHVLLKALALLPSWRCVVVGDGPQRQQLEEMARHIAPGRVHFVGYMPDAADLMAGFDVFCLPSQYEGLGLVLLEAMLRRVPIVATRAGAIPEVLDGGRCGRQTDVGDADAMARAIAEAEADAAGSEQMTSRAYERATREFSVARMVHQTAECYRWDS